MQGAHEAHHKTVCPQHGNKECTQLLHGAAPPLHDLHNESYSCTSGIEQAVQQGPDARHWQPLDKVQLVLIGGFSWCLQPLRLRWSPILSTALVRLSQSHLLQVLHQTINPPGSLQRFIYFVLPAP